LDFTSVLASSIITCLNSTVYTRRDTITFSYAAHFPLNRGTAVNNKVINGDNRAARHKAGEIGSLDLIQLPLETGADISAITSDENQTSLYWAEKDGQQKTELLIQRRENITTLIRTEKHH
jgi:hypothetical protein